MNDTRIDVQGCPMAQQAPPPCQTNTAEQTADWRGRKWRKILLGGAGIACGTGFVLIGVGVGLKNDPTAIAGMALEVFALIDYLATNYVLPCTKIPDEQMQYIPD
jgi:hypothetical protein